MTKTLLIKAPIFDGLLAELNDEYEVHHLLDDGERAAFVAENGARVDAVLTNGTKGFTAAEMDTMPNVGLVSCFGAGYEGVDLEVAKARGIAVSHGPGANDVSVADHAMALLFTIVRGIVKADANIRNGGWKHPDDNWPILTGKTLGIIGLGRIGRRIATRAAGFDMKIHYHNRSPRDDVDYVYEKTPIDLATVSDFVIIVAPGGKETHHMVNADFLTALGPQGYVLNLGRGPIVDNDALAAALANGVIAAAALDVFDGEPVVPEVLLNAPNLVITPHIGGRAPESRLIMSALYQRNLTNFFAGDPLETPVPGM
ncbi:MAG: lactate dehydrogenase-like 2-hydroxyacid dehydrogenase [Alphaproteobacteria bacterium]|jgi:lactate dehydrogenase-like 2-hydroxyacid dehydrogenase